MHSVLSVLHHPFWKGFGGAAIALVIGLLLLHLWADHVALHQLADYINLKAPAINRLPAE